jgi:hypothetical protein
MITIKGYIISIIRHLIRQRHYASKKRPLGGVSPQGGRVILFLWSSPSNLSSNKSLQVGENGQRVRYYDWRGNCWEAIRQFKEFERGRKVFEFKHGGGKL